MADKINFSDVKDYADFVALADDKKEAYFNKLHADYINFRNWWLSSDANKAEVEKQLDALQAEFDVYKERSIVTLRSFCDASTIEELNAAKSALLINLLTASK